MTRGNDYETAGLNRPRQQYHFLYGSLDDRVRTTGAASPTGDQDSLVGESLVPTDNEQDVTPTTSEQDFQQLIMTNGNGVSIITNGSSHRKKSWLYRLRNNSFRERHPMLYGLCLTAAVFVFFFVVAVVIFPNSRLARVATTPRSELSFLMPFETVDRSDYEEPVTDIIRVELFDPSLIYKGPDPSRTFIFPFPTGAFWTNFVLEPTKDRGLSYPVAVYPYAYKWSDTLLQVSYPARHREEDPKAIHDYFFPDLTFESAESISRRYLTYFDALSVTLKFATTSNSYWETYLVQGSPYVTIKYDNASPVVRAFSIFDNVFCPREDVKFSEVLGGGKGGGGRRRLSFGICESEADVNGRDLLLRGVQFVLQSQEGMQWMVFTSEPIEFRFNTERKTTVEATSRFKGVIRLALMPQKLPTTSAPQTAKNISAQIVDSTGLQRLIYHAGVYPVSGDISWSFRSADMTSSLKMAAKSITGSVGLSQSGSSSASPTQSQPSTGRIGTLSFSFKTMTFSPPSSATTPKDLLMLALPHHAQSLPPGSQLSSDQFDLVYKCIKGPMRPVLGTTWSYDEALPSIGFDKLPTTKDELSRKGYMDAGVRSTIIECLKQDIKLALPTLDENVYGFGKQSARLAQLAHIAHQLQPMNGTDSKVSTDSELGDLLDEAVHRLSFSLEHFLTGNVSDYLVYDGNLGGLVSQNGLLNSEADFGNGRYNDHHFHYGYILYACAVLGKIKPAFAQQFSHQVDAIYYDVAYDSNIVAGRASGVYFPAARHKVWFDGHSFASGLFPFGNGKSQESSSEAVNCYYGAYLWSLVKHEAAVDPESDISSQTDFARLLLATEIRGAQLYWHMKPPSPSVLNKTESTTTVYSPQFSKNFMVGNLGMLDAISSTWFGTESLYVHMINEIPVTAVTEVLFDKPFVSQEYVEILEPLGSGIQMAWYGYVICNHAILDPPASWEEAQSLRSPELDSGLSKSQVLYWIATRPGFNVTSVASNETKTNASSQSSKTPSHKKDAQCSSNSACSNAGLGDLCCPTREGVILECCDA